MSRLTASPFHKPSPYDFPRPVHPLSPPETDSEAASLYTPGASSSRPMMLGVVEPDLTPSQQANQESPSARFKRVSTLAYNHNSAIRETRERSIQRNSKSLVVVVPPEGITQQHGQLGHTLSSGPRAKLAQGILMPLFPTMYGQLTAIAREFNFPSVAGLCLYLQISEGGITVTPRISDESWPLLWGQLLDGSTPPRPHGLPIGGRIEFDVDVSKGRWYTPWLSATQRDGVPAISHWRGDSRTSFTDDNIANEEQQEISPTTQRTQNPSLTARHMPRKLSLVGRYEAPSQPASQAALSPPVAESQTIPVLSPIVQVDEPRTAKQILESRVNTWRASAASLGPIAIATDAPVPSVEVPLDSAEDVELQLNLDDFTWSISSAGPPSDGPDSPSSVGRLPSVHLDRRIEEDVCLTPSVCTSFGPFDYELHSPTTTASYLPSPDLAQRMIEDSPPTPLTATSWGPASWPTTPLSDYRAPSVDLGARSGWSQPVTPLTCTSWGPGDSPYPPSPYASSYVHTPDAGQRTFDLDEPAPTAARFSFPYYSAFESQPWDHVWPYVHDLSGKPTSQQGSSGLLEWGYPCLNIYPSVYPHLDIYPPISGAALEVNATRPVSVALEVSYPAFDLYPATYPYFNIYVPVAHSVPAANTQPIYKENKKQIPMPSSVLYPNFDIYPAIYPLSGARFVTAVPTATLSVNLAVQYPQFDLYPPIYPFVVPYPPQVALYPTISTLQPVQLNQTEVLYPVFNIYPAVNVSPLSTSTGRTDKIGVLLSTAYPTFNLYPAVYPVVEPYPSVVVFNGEDSLSSSLDASRGAVSEPPSYVGLGYPILTIYPAAYPYFDLYPSTVTSDVDGPLFPPTDASSGAGSKPPSYVGLGYPILNIYPAAYPYFDLYPLSVKSDVEGPLLGSTDASHCARSRSILHEGCGYPILNIYPAVYPHFDLYPALSVIETESTSGLRPVDVLLDAVYPAFDLYPSVYPHLNIYNLAPIAEEQSITVSVLSESLPGLVRLVPDYPMFDLYPAAYPHLEIYPSTVRKQNFTTSLAGRGAFATDRRVSFASTTTVIRPSRARSGTLREQPVLPIVSRRLPPQTRGLPSNPAEGKRRNAGRLPSHLERIFLEFVAGRLRPGNDASSTSNSFEFVAGTFISRRGILSQLSSQFAWTNSEFLAGKFVPGRNSSPRNSEFLSGKYVTGTATQEHEHSGPRKSLEFVAGKFVQTGNNHSLEFLAGKFVSPRAAKPEHEELGLHRSFEFVAGKFVPIADNNSPEFLAGKLLSTKAVTPEHEHSGPRRSLEFVAGKFVPIGNNRSLEFLAGKFVSAGAITPGKSLEFVAGKFAPIWNNPRGRDSREFLAGKLVATGALTLGDEHVNSHRPLEFVAGKFVPIGDNFSPEFLAGKLVAIKAVTTRHERSGARKFLEFLHGEFVLISNHSQHRDPVEFLAGRFVSTKTGMPSNPPAKQMVAASQMGSIEYLAGGFVSVPSSQGGKSLEFLAGKLVARNSLEFLAGRFGPTAFGAKGTSTEYLAGRFVSAKGEAPRTTAPTVPAIWTDQGAPARTRGGGVIRSGFATASDAGAPASRASTKAAFNSRPLPFVPDRGADASKRRSVPSHANLVGSSSGSIRRHVSTAPTLTTTPEVGSSVVQKETGIARARSLSSKPPPPVVPRKPDTLSKSPPPVVPRKHDTSSKAPPPVVPRRPDSLVARRSRVFDTSAPVEKPKPEAPRRLSMRTLGQFPMPPAPPLPTTDGRI